MVRLSGRSFLIIMLSWIVRARPAMAFYARRPPMVSLTRHWMTEPMTNLYQEWSLADDQQLWANREKTFIYSTHSIWMLRLTCSEQGCERTVCGFLAADCDCFN